MNLIGKPNNFKHDPQKVIHNLSSYDLSELEKRILVKGLNHSIAPQKLNYADYCLPFEMLFRNIKGTKILPPDSTDFIQTRLKDIALSSFKEFNDAPGTHSNLTKEESHCLKQLSKRDHLVIQKSDKENSIVILNRSNYKNLVK